MRCWSTPAPPRHPTAGGPDEDVRAPRRRVNLGLVAGFAVLTVGAFALARTETFVDDEAFLHSMVPHHSRAVLVCHEASLEDPDVIALCDSIVETQLEEIAIMQDVLRSS